MKTSEDNFCFVLQGRLNHASFNLKPDHTIIKFDSSEKTRELNIAEGFVRIPFPNEKSFTQGKLTKGIQNHLEITDKYEELEDFKIDKIEVWTLEGMQDMKDDLLQASSQNNSVSTIHSGMYNKFEESSALKCYRENCFLLPNNLTLEEAAYE